MPPLLAWMFLHPDDDCSVTDLARRFKTSQSTVSREADRLAAVGLIKQARRGNLRLIRANADSPLARPLTDLLTLTYGPAAVLGDLLAPVDGVDEAYIYGSWAARYTGGTGPAAPRCRCALAAVLENQAEYPSANQPAFQADDVDRDLPKVRESVEAASKILDQMSP